LTNGKNIQNKKSEISSVAQPTTSSKLGVYDSCPPLATYMW